MESGRSLRRDKMAIDEPSNSAGSASNPSDHTNKFVAIFIVLAALAIGLIIFVPYILALV